MKLGSLAAPPARLVGLLANEVTALRSLGVAPFREVDSTAHVVETWPLSPDVSADAPRPIIGPEDWTSTPYDGPHHHHLISIDHGYVFAKGTVLDRTGGHVLAATHKIYRNDKRRRKLERRGTSVRPYRLLPRIEYYDKEVVAITASNQHFFWHWLLDCLPRLFRLLIDMPEETMIYADQSLPFQRECLKLLGVRTDRVIDASRVPVMQARRLTVPCHQLVDGKQLPEWILAAFRQMAAPLITENANRRLFISRQDASHRRLRNKNEVVALVEQYEFECIQSSLLPVRDQISAFANAETIIALHGGGLANLVFCRPGTHIVELLPRANIDAIYRIASSADLRYNYLKSYRGNSDTAWESLSDYSVDTDLLRSALEKMLHPEENINHVNN
jgi:capsular polysaccharide biosynthesis protein